MRTSVRRSVSGVVLIAGAAVLSACGDQPTAGSASAAPVSEAAATESAPTASPTTESPATETPKTESPTTESPTTGSGGATSEELAAGLLPESAFGPDAEVVQVPADELESWADEDGWAGHWGPWHDDADGAGLPDGLSVEPAACGDALAALPGLSAEEMPAVAAEGAWTDQVHSFEVLAEGPALDGLPLPVDQLLGDCSHVTVDGPWGMTITVDLAAVDVPARGNAAAGLSVTATYPGRTVSALVGVVSQDSRGLVLMQTGNGDAAPDQAAFTALLAQAADAASFD